MPDEEKTSASNRKDTTTESGSPPLPLTPPPPPPPTAQDTHSGFRFMDLPAELRNIVYEYMFITRNGSVRLARSPRSIAIVDSSSRKLVNISHLVKNIRLFHEARHLELSFNHLHSSGSLFLKVLNRGNPKFPVNLRQVTLDGDMKIWKDPPEEVLHRLINLCLDHPRIDMRIHLEDFRFLDGHRMATFYFFIRVINAAIRGKKSALFHCVDNKAITRWQRGKSAKQLDAPNLRFMPRDRSLDEQKLIKLVRRPTAYLRPWIDSLGGPDGALVYIKDVYLHGL